MGLRLGMIAACASVALSGCATGSDGEVAGTVLGAALGAAVGAEMAGRHDSTLGAALGAALGAWVGREIGRQLDDDDRRYHDPVAERALWDSRYGYPHEWRNPRTGVRGVITPRSRSYRDRSGRICRRFEDTIYYPGGARRTVQGIACYERGAWAVERWR